MYFQVNGGSSPVKGGAHRRYPATSRLSSEQRAVIAALFVKHCGLTVAEAADLACTNTTYVGLVRRLSEVDRERLIGDDTYPSLSQLANGRRRRHGDSGRGPVPSTTLGELLHRWFNGRDHHQHNGGHHPDQATQPPQPFGK